MAKLIVCSAKARGWYRGQRFWPGDTLVLRVGDDVPPWAETLDTPAAFKLAGQSKRRRTSFVDVMKAMPTGQPKNASFQEAKVLADLDEPSPPFDPAVAAEEMLS